MDSQHKHELKENDLQQFIAHFGEWWGKHQTKVLLIAIVLAGTILGLRILNNRSVEKQDTTFFNLNMETSPAGFKAIAADADSDAVRAIASLRAADLLLQEAAMPSSGEEGGATPAERKAKLEEARQMYSQAESSSDNALLKLNAQMGLASVAESLGQWDDAVKVYESIKTSAAESHPSFAAQADTRLAILPRVKTEPNFAPEPTPKKPDDTKSGEGKTGNGKTGDTKTGDTKSGDSKAGDSKTGDTKTGDTKTGDTKDASKSGDTKAPTKDAKQPAKSGDAKTSGDTKKAGETKDGTKAP